MKNENQIPEEFRELAKNFADKGFITTSLDNLINWARAGIFTLDDFWFGMLRSRNDANFNA